MLKEEEENNIDLSNHKESKETNFSSFDDWTLFSFYNQDSQINNNKNVYEVNKITIINIWINLNKS
jgi:hypothetical protein